jgi:hypothetical protein
VFRHVRYGLSTEYGAEKKIQRAFQKNSAL